MLQDLFEEKGEGRVTDALRTHDVLLLEYLDCRGGEHRVIGSEVLVERCEASGEKQQENTSALLVLPAWHAELRDRRPPVSFVRA